MRPTHPTVCARAKEPGASSFRDFFLRGREAQAAVGDEKSAELSSGFETAFQLRMSVAMQQLTAQSLLRPPSAVPPARRPHTADTRAKVTCAMLTAAEADLLQQPSRRTQLVNAGACTVR